MAKYSFAPYRKPLGKFKNGKFKFRGKKYYKWFTKPHNLVIQEKSGEYQDVKLTRFAATDSQIKTWLERKYDFRFNSFTEKGSVKVDRSQLKSLGDYGKDLTDLIKLKKDISQLGGTDNSLIKKFNAQTHAIHGRIDTLGAATHRSTHSAPNLAQIPASKEFRSLFMAPKGWDFVGADLANIEIRVLAHYLAPHDDGKYAKKVMSTDMHWEHAKLALFWSKDDRPWDEHTATPEMVTARKASKAFFFGFLYGQGSTIRGVNLTVSSTLDCFNKSTLSRHTVKCGGDDIIELNYTQKEYSKAKAKIERRLKQIDTPEGMLSLFPLKKGEFIEYTDTLVYQSIYGEQVANNFLKNLVGMQDLIKACQLQSKETGYVKALDGRNLYSRSPHSALNLLLQGSAGVVAKKWMVNYHQIAYDKYGIYDPYHFKQQVFVHDEFDCISKKEHTEVLCKALEEGASKVTADYSMNIPIAADSIVGPSWYECH